MLLDDGGGIGTFDPLTRGGREMRLLYLDEAGIANPEPVVVVAGVLVEPDKQWSVAELALKALAAKYLPDAPGAILHAKEIFHGTGAFDRSRMPLSTRLDLLKALLRIPTDLGLPVSVGWYRKDPAKGASLSPQQLGVVNHAVTYLLCLHQADGFLGDSLGGQEKAVVVAEDNPQAKRKIRALHHQFSTGDLPEHGRETMRISHIVDTVHFAEKGHSPLLQLADACAFAISRTLSGRSHAADLYAAMALGTQPPEEFNKPFGQVLMYTYLEQAVGA